MQGREGRPRTSRSLRSQSVSGVRKITDFVQPAAKTKKKMADGMADAALEGAHLQKEKESEVSTCEIKALIQDMQKTMLDKFSALSNDITKLTSRMQVTEAKTEKMETDISTLNRDVVDMTKALDELSTIDVVGTIRELQERIRYLERADLESAVHSRKYNLMIHGINGKEYDNSLTEEKVRTLIEEDLNLGKTFAKSVMISNCHRLPKPRNSTWGNSGDPDPVVVKFVNWADRETVLRSAKYLKRDSKIRIRSHLPAPMAKARAKLSTVAYNKRQEGVHARIRERGATVVMDTREGPSAPWRTAETISVDQIVDFRISGCKSLTI
jgi:hypothetical protein